MLCVHFSCITDTLCDEGFTLAVWLYLGTPTDDFEYVLDSGGLSGRRWGGRSVHSAWRPLESGNCTKEYNRGRNIVAAQCYTSTGAVGTLGYNVEKEGNNGCIH